jgi:hypothetical protein
MLARHTVVPTIKASKGMHKWEEANTGQLDLNYQRVQLPKFNCKIGLKIKVKLRKMPLPICASLLKL